MAYSSQSGANFIPEIWSKEFITLLDTITVMKPIVNTKYQGEIKQGGDVVHVRQYGNVTTNSYTRQQTLTMDEIAFTDNTMNIDQQKYQFFAVDDFDIAQMDMNVMDGLMERSVVSMRNAIDTRLLSHYADANSSNVIGSTSVPVILTPDNVYDYFIDMHSNLDNQGVTSGERNAVITPTTRAVILKSPELRDRSTSMADETIRDGKIGKFAGWTLHVSTNISTVSSSKPHMFFTPEFISFAMQLEKVEKVRPEELMADAVKVAALYGSKVFTECAKSGGVIHVAA